MKVNLSTFDRCAKGGFCIPGASFLPAVSLVTFLLVLLCQGCATHHRAVQEGVARISPCCEAKKSTAAADGMETRSPSSKVGSFGELGSQWQDDHGTWHQLSEFMGKVEIVSMFFCSCQGICVQTLGNMQKIEASLSAKMRANVHFVMITLDPDRDGIKQMHAYRSQESLPESRWTLLRGRGMADTRDMAQFLGVGYGRDNSGRFVHSSTIVALDGQGRVLKRFEGPHSDLAKAVSDIEAAVNLTVKPVTTAKID